MYATAVDFTRRRRDDSPRRPRLRMKVLERENWYISLMLPRLAMTKYRMEQRVAAGV